MTRQLMKLAGGRVIMALEGGYDLPAICDASYECVRALLGDEPLPMRHEELSRRPCQNAIDLLHKVIGIQVGNAVFQFPYLSNRLTNRSFVRLFLTLDNKIATSLAGHQALRLLHRSLILRS